MDLLILSLLLFLIQRNVYVWAAPAAVDPYLAIGLDTSNIDLFRNASTFDSPTLTNISLSTNNPGRRVPNTSTFLILHITKTPIPRYNLNRTIRETQATLRTFISLHNANDTTLAPADNPYKSDPRWEGCYFGVQEFPLGTRLLTYGIVYDVLEGLRLWLYVGGWERKVVFEVRTEQFGPVAMGRISNTPPTPSPPEGIGGGGGGVAEG